MPVQLRAATFASEDPATAARFWASILGRQAIEDAHGLLVPGDPTQVGLRFASSHGQRSDVDGMHLHLTSTSPEHQRSTVARALTLGARHLDVGQRPEEGHVVLADPAGVAFCVIEPRNAYLAGCGFLGEVACEGSRNVGVFWSAALDWPLVWDQNEETAVQSPLGVRRWPGEVRLSRRPVPSSYSTSSSSLAMAILRQPCTGWSRSVRRGDSRQPTEWLCWPTPTACSSVS